MIHTFVLENISQPHEIHIALFKDVSNAAFLRDQLLAGNEAFEYAFIDAATVVSIAHALAAAHQAVHSSILLQKTRTRNVHSEIVFSLSPTNNISEAFRRFGVSPTTSTLLCIKVSTATKPFLTDDIWNHLQEVVDGTPVAFTNDEISSLTEWSKVAKNYKILRPTQTTDLKEVELQVLGKLVMRAVG
ncbi:CGI121 protein [Geopyxis carbonaria]|nr:CGI121 protein [Geopyxis carbonaria]